MDEIEVIDAPIEEKIKEATRKMERLIVNQEFERRYLLEGHATPKEPLHCHECFEGCQKCQSIRQKPGPLSRARV